VTRKELVQWRLRAQRLITPPFQTSQETVRWFGAVQAQDYGGAKWAVAQRTVGATNRSLDADFQDGAFLRTHVMRPTWHFVAPEDIRWLLRLTGPRVHAANASLYRKLELDGALFRRAHKLLRKSLADGNHQTRAEISVMLKQNAIDVTGIRLAYLLIHAELEGLICSGGLSGKQFTYALLDERVRGADRFNHDEALRELTLRFFTSHGPATARDYSWWSGLTVSSVKLGMESAKSRLRREVIDGKTYWMGTEPPAALSKIPTVHLLPNYDEFLVAYKDREPSMSHPAMPISALMGNIIVGRGKIVGGWRRTLTRRSAEVNLNCPSKFSSTERRSIESAAKAYSRFLEIPVQVTDVSDA
jgi:hypothetical protein